MENNYDQYSDENVLIKLHRQFTEHESIQFLIRRLRECLVKAGQQQSFIDELEYKNLRLQRKISKLNNQIKSLKKT